MALRRLGSHALRHAAAAGRTAVPPLPSEASWARLAVAPLPPPSLSSYSTVTTALAAASAAATVAKKVAAATAAAAKTVAAARKATTGGAAVAASASTLLQRAGGALFEAGGGARGGGAAAAALAAGTAAISAAVARGGSSGPTAAATAAATAATTATTAARRREALLRHASAVDRAFRLSRGRLPGTPFRIWRGLPFARVAARAAHGTALVALAIGHGCPVTLTTHLVANLAAESCLRAVPVAGGPLAYVVFEKGMGTYGLTNNVALLERWAAKEEAREARAAASAAASSSVAGKLLSGLRPPWRRGVGPATARRRKGWGVWGTARKAVMLAGAAAVLALLPACVAATSILTAAKWVLAAFFDSGFG